MPDVITFFFSGLEVFTPIFLQFYQKQGSPNTIIEQECIPVGCIPLAAVAIGRGVMSPPGTPLLLWPSVMAFWPPQPEGHNRRPHPPWEQASAPGADPPGTRHPPCCKACWDTTCNACWDSTPPPVNRITHV